MPRKRVVSLTPHQLRLMNVLWACKEATVAEIVAALDSPPLAYTTVMTTLGVLEDKGYVSHVKSGRAYVYRPLVQRSDAARTLLDTLLDRFFRNSPGGLALALVQDERLSEEDIAALRRVLEQKKVTP